MKTTSQSHDRFGPFWLALVLALVACAVIALFRFYPPGVWNLASVGALALFCGGRLRSWWSLALPLGLMLATDYWLSVARPGNPFFHPDTPLVYASYVLLFALGRIFAQTENPLQLGLLSFGGSVLFFLITNFSVWLNVVVLQTIPMVPEFAGYDDGLSGLLLCYEKALPFYRGTLIGDLVFTAVLFGSHALLWRAIPQTETSTQEAAS